MTSKRVLSIVLSIVLALGAGVFAAEHAGPVTDILIVDERVMSVSQAGLLVGESVTMASFFEAPFRLTSIATFPPEGGVAARLLCAGGEPGVSGSIGLVDLASRDFVSQRVSDDLVYDVAVHPTKPLAAVACADYRVLLFELPSLRESPLQTRHHHTGSVRAICFSPDGRYLASGGLGGLVFLSTVPPQGRPVVIRDHSDKVECLAFSADSRQLASGARDGKVRIHSNTGRLLRTYSGLGRDADAGAWTGRPQVLSMAWAQRPGRIVVGMSTGTMYELSPVDTSWRRMESALGQDPVTSLCLTPEGNLLVGSQGLERVRSP